MSSRTLPSQPSLDQLKLQAKELRREHRARSLSAGARIAAQHPRLKALRPEQILAEKFSVADSQLVLAREYGFPSWAALKHRVDLDARIAAIKPHPRFDEAVAAFDAGDLAKLRVLLQDYPDLVRARGNLAPPYHYFTAATLLHYVAGNPGRETPLPPNVVDIARLLLGAGADPNAETIAPNGGATTVGLINTSAQASERNVSGPLLELLLAHGATLDLHSPGCLDPALANHAPRAAEKMIELGAKADLFAAAALGRLDLLRDCFDDAGKLRSRPKRDGKLMNERDAIGLALLYAYVREQKDAVDFLLEKDGNWNMTGVNNGTALHRAAGSGNLAMVQRLVARGADINNRDNPFVATPLSWADHMKYEEVAAWIRANGAIDLHDAIAFNVEARVAECLRKNAQSVNARLDFWRIPQATPLHVAALQNRGNFATLLLEHGAEANALAGDGRTALDIAEQGKADEVVSVLKQHGGKRAEELK